MEMNYVISGDPRTKKNSPVIINGAGGKNPILLPSKQYREYEKQALLQIQQWRYQFKVHKEPPIDYPVNVKCVYYMKTRRKVDLNNLLEASTDILVKAGVLADDNNTIVAGHDGSRVLYSKENPRVEILISEMRDDEISGMENNTGI